MPRYPILPRQPPGGLNRICGFEPFSRALRKVWVLPVAILTARWANDASDVAGIGEYELNWPLVELGRSIGRLPRCDMVLPRRQYESRRRDLCEVDRNPSKTDPARNGKSVLVIHVTQ